MGKPGDSTLFERYIGIDYSGARTPVASLKGLRVYASGVGGLPVEVLPPPSPRMYWTRRGIAQWIVERLDERVPTLIGIDHAFSFPMKYFDRHRLAHHWPTFLDDFFDHWPTDRDGVSVEDVRCGRAGDGAARLGDAKWRRLVEVRSRAAKSVFHFDVQGSVAKSTHAGLPWLRFVRASFPGRVHFWPFDGWTPPAGRSVIAEVYPSLWSKDHPREGRTPDQHDAWSVARWMQETDRSGELAPFFVPQLTDDERAVAAIEGWILGLR